MEKQFVAQRFNSLIPLVFDALGNQVGDNPLFQPGHVAFEHIVSHQHFIHKSLFFQIVGQDESPRVECNQALYTGMFFKEQVQYLFIRYWVVGLQELAVYFVK